MAEPTKIDFRYRHINKIEDITDFVKILFPGNRNQQHAAARILMALKPLKKPLSSLKHLEGQYGISRRTVQRTRAKLARLGLIEHVTWMNTQYGGQQGWKVSSRMISALRQLAGYIETWRKDRRSDRAVKDSQLADLLK